MSLFETPDCVEVEPEMVIAYQALIIAELQHQVACLVAQNRLTQQLAEALGDVNRDYASKALGRHANDNEAFLHYVFKGGKEHFDEVHPATPVAA